MPGNLVHLRRRIRSVRNTQKLTKAMKTVSAAKLRRASSELNKTRPYMEKLESLLFEVARRLKLQTHPLFLVRDKGAKILVAVTADKGLCGAFNSHIIRKVEERYRELIQDGSEVFMVTVGNKGHRYFSKNHFPIKKNFPSILGRLRHENALEVADYLQQVYSNEEITAVEMVCTEFISASKQRQGVIALLPLPRPVASEEEDEEIYILEPDAPSLFNLLLPRYIQTRIYRLLIGSVASEEASRMVAMDLATRNASDMIRALHLSLNKLRQALITKELLEIMTATEALKK